MSLLEEPDTHRKRNVYSAIDHIRDRFGTNSIALARTMHTNMREKVHENPFDLEGKAGNRVPADPDE